MRRSATVVGLYERASRGYDHATRRFDGLRVEAIERLELLPGNRVVDVACGTGVNFERLVERVGATGQVIGVDVSPDMLQQAADRVRAAGWPNVTLIESTVEEVTVEPPADAALFSLTHDVLQSPQAVRQVVAQLEPGARVAAFGAKRAARWLVPVNAYVRWKSRRYITDLSGLERPWRVLEAELGRLDVEGRALGGAYLASGRTPGPITTTGAPRSG